MGASEARRRTERDGQAGDVGGGGIIVVVASRRSREEAVVMCVCRNARLSSRRRGRGAHACDIAAVSSSFLFALLSSSASPANVASRVRVVPRALRVSADLNWAVPKEGRRAAPRAERFRAIPYKNSSPVS